MEATIEAPTEATAEASAADEAKAEANAATQMETAAKAAEKPKDGIDSTGADARPEATDPKPAKPVIITRMAELQARQRQQWRSRYWGLVQRNHLCREAPFSDEAELLDLMDKLGIDADQLDTDLQLFADRDKTARTSHRLREELADLERKRDSVASELAQLAVVDGDTAKLIRSAEAGMVLALRDQKIAEMYLRSRGWKLVADGWMSPENGTWSLIEAMQRQTRADAKPVIGLLENLHQANDAAIGIKTHFKLPVL